MGFCKIEYSKFKDTDAVKFETLKFRALFLPYNGGKLASLVDVKTGKELLAQDENPHYIPQTLSGEYVKSEVSGADDMFPTIDPCRVGLGNKLYPCHGEVCRVAHKLRLEDGFFETEYVSKELGYKYTKKITADEGGAIVVSYVISNETPYDLPCLWAMHFMIAAVKGGEVLTPYTDGSLGEIMFDEKSEFGKGGDSVATNRKMLLSGEFSKEGNAYKFYYTQPLKNGICGYYNPLTDKTLTLNYDKDKIPYLGVWMNNGMFKNMYNAAIEPCTVPFDSPANAESRGYTCTIEKNKKISFDITIDLLGGKVL